uniref:Helicase n=1 Tax=viral metagenome TaxID=1070528 RepID=A0A6C0H8P3_9ZZZZ
MNNMKTYFNFDYKLDNFQLIGCQVIHNNENLLVTAHTGSGKTALALEAIAKTLSENDQVIYISPIKALSNQKYAEFKQHFESIGIMTGDIKINPLADLLIMTAEIFRNSISRNQNEIINYEWNFNPNKVKCVIIDEIHSINLPERGKVWEEIILYLDNKIQLIMLSATISEAAKFADWITKLKNIKCHLVSTNKRPVPLQHGIWWNNKINYFLIGDTNWKKYIWTNTSNQINKLHKNSLLEFFNCTKYLFENNMTPANVFLLNRNLCYKYAEKLSQHYNHFVSIDEIIKIQNIWNYRLYKYKNIYETSIEWINLYKLVSKGIGVHHSGMIPILKEIVEILYSEGLIKILLATETFAMGVNMPTKTVIFFNIDKFDGHSTKRLLKPEEYGQMAGRAGRRGKDDIGYVIVLPSNNFINEETAKKIILSSPQKLSSKFSIDISYVLKNLTKSDLCYESLFYYQEFDEKYYEYIKNKLNEITPPEENNEIISTNKSLIETYNKLKTELNNLEIIKNKEMIKNQIKTIIEFLKIEKYLDEDSKLTIKGKIISEIHECNPLLLGYIIFNNLLDDLNFCEIIAICSILINEVKTDNEISISELNCSLECKDVLKHINEQINNFIILENNLNASLAYPIWLNWKITYELFDNVKMWANKEKIEPSGNFIKTILRITNLLKNIENIINITNNIKLINKLYNYQEILIRDVVINDSLYLLG